MNDLTAVVERGKTVIAPLDAKLDEVVKLGQILGSRRKLSWAFLSDAWATSVAVLTLLRARAEGAAPISADSIEVLVRRVIEQAIVLRYVSNADSRNVVLRFLKTGQTEFNKSFKENRDDQPEEVKNLPKYAQMAADDPDLLSSYGQLSFTSHPRGAQPYSMRQQIGIEELGEKPNEVFIRRASKALEHLALGIERLLSAYATVDALGLHEQEDDRDDESDSAPGRS